MSPLVVVCFLVGSFLLTCEADKLPNQSSSTLLQERPRLLLKRSAARNPRDVPLSSFGRFGEREGDNDTVAIATSLPEVETTEIVLVETTQSSKQSSTESSTQSSTETKQETTTPQTNTSKGPFGFEFTLPGLPFKFDGSKNNDNKPPGQPAEGASSSSPGFQFQAPKLPSFGFGRK